MEEAGDDCFKLIKIDIYVSLVRILSCPDPVEITNKTDLYESKFRKDLQLMVDIRRMKIIDCDATQERFSTFARAAKNVPEVRVFDKAKSTCKLDKFYYSVMGTNEDYNEVWSVFRTLLVFPHGQASIERSFSINKNTTTRNISEDTLGARRSIKDYILHLEV